jgi:hypothetical protein
VNPYDRCEPDERKRGTQGRAASEGVDRAAAIELVRKAVESALVQAELIGGRYPTPQQIGEMTVAALIAADVIQPNEGETE